MIPFHLGASRGCSNASEFIDVDFRRGSEGVRPFSTGTLWTDRSCAFEILGARFTESFRVSEGERVCGSGAPARDSLS